MPERGEDRQAAIQESLLEVKVQYNEELTEAIQESKRDIKKSDEPPALAAKQNETIAQHSQRAIRLHQYSSISVKYRKTHK